MLDTGPHSVRLMKAIIGGYPPCPQLAEGAETGAPASECHRHKIGRRKLRLCPCDFAAAENIPIAVGQATLSLSFKGGGISQKVTLVIPLCSTMAVVNKQLACLGLLLAFWKKIPGKNEKLPLECVPFRVALPFRAALIPFVATNPPDTFPFHWQGAGCSEIARRCPRVHKIRFTRQGFTKIEVGTPGHVHKAA